MDGKLQQATFERWMGEHLGVVRRVAAGFARAEDREDLVQEIMLSIWKAVPAFQGGAQVSTFIYRVAHNAALGWYRGERRRTRWKEEAHHLVREEEAPAESDGESERLEQIYRAIHELREADRSLILLSLDGLSYRDMAAVTGLSESNVGVRLNRIRKQLVTILKEKEEL